MPKFGKFVVFEGGEGSGKSSTAKYVVESLKEKGVDAVLTREPGGSPFAERLRTAILSPEAAQAHPEVLFQLFWLARSDHLSNVILPAISRGAVVVSDRFDGSTYAYQVVAQERPELKPLFWKMRATYVGHFAPRLYFFFDVDPATGLARMRRRKEDATHFDNRELDFHTRIREGYREFFGSRDIPSVRIYADQPEEQVREYVLKLVEDMNV